MKKFFIDMSAWIIVTALAVIGAMAITTRIVRGEPYRPVEVHTIAPRTPWYGDISEPYARCVAAMASAEIPPSIGQCTRPRVTEDMPGESDDAGVFVPWGWRIPA